MLTLLAVVALTGATARAADDSFVGKWKFNPEKSQMTGLTYKFEDAGDGKYRLSFGDDSETLAFDGKDHATKYGSTWAISKTGDNSWKFTRKREGKVTATEMWTISDDTFTAVGDNKRPDGSTSHDETKFKRTEGSSGIVGTWETTEVKVGSPTTMEITAWASDGFKIENPTSKEHMEFKLDGKEYADKGPRVPKGMTVSAKKTDDHNIELTFKLKDKNMEKDRWELSSDGKTITNTITFPGQSKNEVDVFDRK